MHNRLKVRTSAEMQVLNKMKELEKARIYATSMKELLEKRKSECHETVMSLSAEILHMNPDVSTVWNIRKELLLKFKNDDTEMMKSIVTEELKLTEAGLHLNPKSYCAWYHRCWILNNFGTEKDWMKELHVCTKYLEVDERNFHCWDYRKYIVERLSTQLEKELEFSLQKLSANFSNYSAWHYRSKLIPRIHSKFERNNLFQTDVYQQEISLVENAVYTDPNDQSAWFYHRWLLSHIRSCPKFIQAGFDKHTALVWVVIHPISSHIQVNGFGDGSWQFLNGKKSCRIFIKNLRNVETFSEHIKLFENNEEIDSLTLTSEGHVSRALNIKPTLTSEEINSLKEQLSSFEQLSQMEVNSKWPLLACVFLQEKLGCVVEESALKKLQVFDNYRTNYYSDLISFCKVETLLASVTDFSGNFIGSCSRLTAFPFNFCFTLFKQVDLSENPLGNDVIRQLETLLSCEILKLSQCEITSIDEFPPMFNLKVLDLSGNKIKCNTLPNGLSECSKLEYMNLTNSALSPSVCEKITILFPKLSLIF